MEDLPEARITEVNADAEYARLSVSDTGHGMSPDTAFADLARAVSAAGRNGNVWLRRGVYEVSTLEVPAGISICGTRSCSRLGDARTAGVHRCRRRR